MKATAKKDAIIFPSFGTGRYRLGSATHKFDGHLLIVEQIGTLKDDTKGALPDFLSDSVVDADDVGRRGSHGCGARYGSSRFRWRFGLIKD